MRTLFILILALPVFAEQDNSSVSWDPFEWSLMSYLDLNYPVVSVSDGGIGSRTIIASGSGSSVMPNIFRDGVPLNFGHRWADSPWHISLSGVKIDNYDTQIDPFGNDAGTLDMQWTASDSTATVTEAKFGKGPHENYLRRISFQTRTAPWIFRYAFDEIIDEEGYPFLPAGDSRVMSYGSSKSRISSLNILRDYGEGRSLSFTHETVRQHRTGIPSDGTNFEDFWGDRTAAKWSSPLGEGQLSINLFSNGADIERDRGRKVESLRNGLKTDYQNSPIGTFSFELLADRISDNGIGLEWVENYSQEQFSERAASNLAWFNNFTTFGFNCKTSLAAKWDRYAKWKSSGSLGVVIDLVNPIYFSLSHGGRSANNSELWTLDTRSTSNALYALVPEENLGWENLTELRMETDGSVYGFDWQLKSSFREIDNAIGLVPLDFENQFTWSNDVEMSTLATNICLQREFDVFGSLLAKSLYSFNNNSITNGMPAVVLPKQAGCFQLLWERELFDEDGILEIGFDNVLRSRMSDPWVPGNDEDLPAIFLQNLRFGFRLIGADLGIEFRNLGGSQVRLSNGAVSNEREMRYRLQWNIYN